MSTKPNYVKIYLEELGGTAVRIFGISWISLLVHASDFYNGGRTPLFATILPIAAVIFQCVYVTTVMFPERKFKPAIGGLQAQDATVLAVEVGAQLTGAIVGATVTRVLNAGVLIPRTYMQCGSFYHKDTASTVGLIVLCCFCSSLITFTTLWSQSMKPFKKAYFMAMVYSLVALLCYQMGGYNDAVAWFGSNIVNGCWSFTSFTLGFDAAADMINVDMLLYVVSDAWGIALGSILYLVHFYLPAQQKHKNE